MNIESNLATKMLLLQLQTSITTFININNLLNLYFYFHFRVSGVVDEDDYLTIFSIRSFSNRLILQNKFYPVIWKI